ncbi:MAG: DsbA family protein [Vicinamibacterales bacterium]
MSADTNNQDLSHPVTDADHRQGPDDAPVTVVMYGDYECPETRAAHPVLQRLRARFGDELRFVFRHFPRTDVHPNARRAAVVAEAAGEQGRFWDTHDALMEHSGPLDDAALLHIASGAGVPEDAFDDPADAMLPSVARIDDHVVTGRRAGVDETPTIFINGLRHRGSYDERTLQAAIDLAR